MICSSPIEVTSPNPLVFVCVISAEHLLLHHHPNIASSSFCSCNAIKNHLDPHAKTDFYALISTYTFDCCCFEVLGFTSKQANRQASKQAGKQACKHFIYQPRLEFLQLSSSFGLGAPSGYL